MTKRIPATQVGHLSAFGPLHHPKTARGPRKGGAAFQFNTSMKKQKPVVLGWKTKKEAA